MKIHTVLRRGYEHKTFCEDFLVTHDEDNFFVGVILDGCSTGKESHFASSLLGKIFRKSINRRKSLWVYADKTTFFNSLIETTIDNLLRTRTELYLDVMEMLSTIIVAIYDKRDKSLLIVFIGDGVAVVNGETFEVDQDNTPDYLAYHLDRIGNYGGYENYFASLKKFNFTYVNDFSICSDGLLSFKKIKDFETTIDVKKYLTEDTYLVNNPIMLARKCNMLESKYGFSHADDLSIIRVVNPAQYEIKLPQQLIDKLIGMKEFGMGYHIVDVVMKNETYHGQKVLNSSIWVSDNEVKTEDILDVK